MSNIDTLYFEPVGSSGGNYFESISFENVKELIFRGRFHFRRDGVKLVFNGSGSESIGDTSEANTLKYTKSEIDAAKRVKVGFRTSTDEKDKIDGEPYYGGAYRISFETPVDPEGDELKDREKFGYLEYMQFPVPDGFFVNGFHGNFGDRIDKFGIVLEKKVK